MSPRWLGTALAVVVLLGLSSPAGATPAAIEGVHGAATQTLPNWRLAVNVNRGPSDALAGTIQFFAFETELFEWSRIEAQPIALEVSGDTACVVGEVTSFSIRGGDLGYTPELLVLAIRDVEGGPDLFSVLVIPTDFVGDRDFCSFIEPLIPVEAGEFTIIGNM